LRTHGREEIDQAEAPQPLDRAKWFFDGSRFSGRPKGRLRHPALSCCVSCGVSIL
jgi:hypothetical protein